MNPWMEAGLRTCLVAMAAAAGLALFRPANAYVRRGVWRAVLLAALAMPALLVLVPRLPVWETAARRSMTVVRPMEISGADLAITTASPPVPWLSLVSMGISAALLLRLAAAWVAARRIVKAGAVVARDVVESPGCRVPFVAHSTVVLPVDWRSWPEERVAAVLAHERAHIAGRDELFQALAEVHRVCFWWSPLAWWLPRRLAALAEEIADDAVLRADHDRVAYAETLVDYLARARAERWSAVGVAMARAGAAAGRIDRILDASRELAHPLSPRRMAALTALLMPLVWLSAACTTAAAQRPAPAAAAKPAEKAKRSELRDAFALVQGESVQMSGSIDDAVHARSLGSRLGTDYLWFRRGAKTFVVSDPAIVKEVQAIFEPQEKLGEEQAALGERQAKLGEQQAKLGEEQARLGERQARLDQQSAEEEVDRLREAYARARKTYRESHPDLLAIRSAWARAQQRVAAIQERVAEEHAQLGEQQGELGHRQAELGERQAELGSQQAKLGAEQARLAGIAEQQLQALLDRLIAEGRAQPEESLRRK